jgi:ribosomal protein S18 acetylase RimI-like enzyme
VIAHVTVRLATQADAADIASMSREYIEQGLPWSWTPARVLRAIADPEANVAVVGERGALEAFGIMQYPGDDAHLLLFAVRAASRRKGIGSALLQWLEEVARCAGAKRIRLEARRQNAAARNFYCEHGYHELVIAAGLYPGREDGVKLEKWLRLEEAT